MRFSLGLGLLLAGYAAGFSTISSLLPKPAHSAAGYRSPAPILLMQAEGNQHIVARRGALFKIAGLAVGAAATALPASASDSDVEIYVGAGCFWHVQHEVTEAERKILKRSPTEYTAVAGYAGGTKTGKDGKVCYHNLMMDSDYGRMGHTEVVGFKTPESKVPEFAALLVDRLWVKGIRADPQDRGGEYRSALGLPGGISNPMTAYFQAAAEKKGMKLVDGSGDEGDTLKDRSILVYDTKNFPFYAGEVYHQYHDDMVEKYGSEYKALRDVGVKRGAFAPTGCPEIGLFSG